MRLSNLLKDIDCGSGRARIQILTPETIITSLYYLPYSVFFYFLEKKTAVGSSLNSLS